MANELRKNIGRSMHYTQLNENIDEQIRQLQARTAYDVNAQMQINDLLHQKSINEQQMMQPMSAAEYDEYDDNGQYIGNQAQIPMQTQPTAGFGQTLADGINHTAQGISLGWSDEAFGAIGGAGRVAANGLMRALGQNVNGESFSDAWNKGYQEYRDFARQELNDGYQRNPAVSTSAGIIGSAMSPVKIYTPRNYIGSLGNKIATSADIAKSRWINTVGVGAINGAGSTNENTPTEYGKNIFNSVITNTMGTVGGNALFGSGNNMYRFGRGVMNAGVQMITPTFRNKENTYE